MADWWHKKVQHFEIWRISHQKAISWGAMAFYAFYASGKISQIVTVGISGAVGSIDLYDVDATLWGNVAATLATPLVTDVVGVRIGQLLFTLVVILYRIELSYFM